MIFRSGYPFILLLLISTSCHRRTYTYTIDSATNRVKASTNISLALDSLMSPYRAEYKRRMFDTLALNRKILLKENPEGTLGNWVIDGMQWYSDSIMRIPTDFVITNYGSIRVGSISEGPVLLKDIYELMPFDNTLAILEVDSAIIDSIAYSICQAGGWPVSRGYRIHSEGKTCRWSLQKRTKGSKFILLTSDFLANGGERLNFLKPIPRKYTLTFLRDALIAYARYQKHLSAQKEMRIIRIP